MLKIGICAALHGCQACQWEDRAYPVALSFLCRLISAGRVVVSQPTILPAAQVTFLPGLLHVSCWLISAVRVVHSVVQDRVKAELDHTECHPCCGVSACAAAVDMMGQFACRMSDTILCPPRVVWVGACVTAIGLRKILVAGSLRPCMLGSAADQEDKCRLVFNTWRPSLPSCRWQAGLDFTGRHLCLGFRHKACAILFRSTHDRTVITPYHTT
jgi:hypothetical protein